MTEESPGEGASAAIVAKYHARKDRALATIVLSIEPSLLYLLGDDPKEPVDVWNKLKDQFQKKTWANKLVLRRKLHSLRLKEGESVQDHIKQMTELFNELAVVGAQLDEEDRVVHLLASLPESYDTLVTALEASEKLPSMEIVIDRLLYEERKSRDRQGEAETDREGALVLKNKSNWKRGIRCHYCRKLGYMQKDCYERERKNNKSKRPSQRVDKASVKKKNEDGNCIGLLASSHALAANDSRINGARRIIDSGATCHICCNRMMFDKMEDMDTPQVVTLGDGRSIETTRRGTVQLKLKQLDGTHKSGTLHDVLYVPELPYNLLSIAKATEFGKTARFDKCTCEIINEDEDVIGSATKCGSLYYLNCQMINPHQRINTVKERSQINQRYGHLSITSLKKLPMKS